MPGSATVGGSECGCSPSSPKSRDWPERRRHHLAPLCPTPRKSPPKKLSTNRHIVNPRMRQIATAPVCKSTIQRSYLTLCFAFRGRRKHGRAPVTRPASIMATSTQGAGEEFDPEVRIGLAQQPEDVVQGFECACNTFGRQTQDAIWMGFNPGWDTPEGQALCAARMVKDWQNPTRDDRGKLNTMYVVATVPDSDQASSRKVVGLAIWLQLAFVQGQGNPPNEEAALARTLEGLYPHDASQRGHLCRLMVSLHRQRIALLKESANTSSPAVMVLDLCTVDPAYQRRGIASKLVQWGLDEAQRRGGIEASTEGSKMGRGVYAKLGFEQEGPEIEYDVDPEFASRPLPSNVFMRRPA